MIEHDDTIAYINLDVPTHGKFAQIVCNRLDEKEGTFVMTFPLLADSIVVKAKIDEHGKKQFDWNCLPVMLDRVLVMMGKLCCCKVIEEMAQKELGIKREVAMTYLGARPLLSAPPKQPYTCVEDVKKHITDMAAVFEAAQAQSHFCARHYIGGSVMTCRTPDFLVINTDKKHFL